MCSLSGDKNVHVGWSFHAGQLKQQIPSQLSILSTNKMAGLTLS